MKVGCLVRLSAPAGGRVGLCPRLFTARGGPGEVNVWRRVLPAIIAAIELSNQTFFVQSSSYLAGDGSLTVDTKWGGAKSFFAGEGLFVLQVQGQGLLLVSSFGAIQP